MKTTLRITSPRRAAVASLCAAVGLLGAAAPGQAAPKLKPQKFYVSFEGTRTQDWVLRTSDEEHSPNCLFGPGARGASSLTATSNGAIVVAGFANRKAGIGSGSVPIEATLQHDFVLGSLPPVDCDDIEYRRLAAEKDCDRKAWWAGDDLVRSAYASFSFTRGKVRAGIRLGRETDVINNDLFDCPSLGFEETKLDGAARVTTEDLWSGKPVTVTLRKSVYFPPPKYHETKGQYEWTVTIKALTRKKK